jgi:tetratricopeptide (TPR) repeat protein
MHEKAIELAPDDHWLWGKLAAAWEQVDGEEERSRAAFERAIVLAEERLRVEAEDAQTMAYLASYLVALGEGERARQTVSLATQLEPENPETWYFSGLVNARLGNREQAIEDLQRALALGYSGRLIAHDPAFTNLGDTGLLMGLAEQFTTN